MWLELIAAGLMVFVVLILDNITRELRKLRSGFVAYAEQMERIASKEVHVTVTAQNAPPSLPDAPQPTAKPARRVWPDG